MIETNGSDAVAARAGNWAGSGSKFVVTGVDAEGRWWFGPGARKVAALESASRFTSASAAVRAAAAMAGEVVEVPE